MSIAKIELMSLDVPRVDYKSDESKDKEGKVKPKKADDESVRLQLEANERARKRREKEQWTKMKLTDLNNTQQTTYNG